MNYYLWNNTYEGGLVKADSEVQAHHQVVMSQGKCESIYLLEEKDFDGYGVAVLSRI